MKQSKDKNMKNGKKTIKDSSEEMKKAKRARELAAYHRKMKDPAYAAHRRLINNASYQRNRKDPQWVERIGARRRASDARKRDKELQKIREGKV